MLRLTLLVVLSTLCLSAVPVLIYAQEEEFVNLVLNPSFEEDEVILNDPAWQAWATWGDQDGVNSTVEIDETEFIDGSRSLRIDPVGAVNWHFIVLNLPMDVSFGEEYTASFWVKAAEKRPFAAKFKATDNTVSFGETVFGLTTEWAEYHFTAESQTNQLKLEFFCAASEAPIWLDFVNVYEGKYVEGILPSEMGGGNQAVQPAGKLPVRWSEIKSPTETR